jgi:hypothetical protein
MKSEMENRIKKKSILDTKELDEDMIKSITNGV